MTRYFWPSIRQLTLSRPSLWRTDLVPPLLNHMMTFCTTLWKPPHSNMDGMLISPARNIIASIMIAYPAPSWHIFIKTLQNSSDACSSHIFKLTLINIHTQKDILVNVIIYFFWGGGGGFSLKRGRVGKTNTFILYKCSLFCEFLRTKWVRGDQYLSSLIVLPAILSEASLTI